MNILNIAIDIDDTITDTYESMMPLVAINYDLDLKKLWANKPSYKELSKTLPNFDEFIQNNYHILANIVSVKEDAIKVLKKLRSEGHRIIIITARNTEEYSNPYKLTYDFLVSKGIPFDKLITNVGNKGLQCATEGIDVFMDDNTKNCKSAMKYNINTYQFKSNFCSQEDKIKRVNNWDEFYNIISNMSKEANN